MKTVLLRVLALVALGALIYVARDLPLADGLAALQFWASEHPLFGAIAYISVTIIAIALLTPGWILMMLAGLTFGLMPGLLYAMLGIVGGAIAAFYVGRTLARKWVERRVADNIHLLALGDALEDQAFTIVALTRIALVFPFNVLNYAYGVTRVHLREYVAGTAVGMLPIVTIYVYLGTLTRDLSQILDEGAAIGPGAWWAAGVAIIAIISVVLVVRRALQRAMQRRTGEKSG